METDKNKNGSIAETITLLIVLVCTAMILAEMAINLSGEVDIVLKSTATQVMPSATSTRGPRPTLPPDYTPEPIHDS